MKHLVVAYLLLGVSFSVSPVGAADDPAPYKGYAVINEILKERVTGPGSFQLGQYVGEPYDVPNPGSLVELLGTYSGTDTDGGFRNGLPNSVNLLLWSILLSRFSDDIGATCAAPKAEAHGIRLAKDFQAALSPLCQWPAAPAMSPAALKVYWMALVGDDAPDAEFNSWFAFATQQVGARYPAPAAVSRITVAALMNPYFLLRD